MPGINVNNPPSTPMTLEEVGGQISPGITFTDHSPDTLIKPGSMKVDMSNHKAFVSDNTVISCMPRQVVSEYAQASQQLQLAHKLSQAQKGKDHQTLQQYFKPSGKQVGLGNLRTTKESTFTEVSQKKVDVQLGGISTGEIAIEGRQSWLTRFLRAIGSAIGLVDSASEKRGEAILNNLNNFRTKFSTELLKSGASSDHVRDSVGAVSRLSVQDVKDSLKQAFPNDPDFEEGSEMLEKIATKLLTEMQEGALAAVGKHTESLAKESLSNFQDKKKTYEKSFQETQDQLVDLRTKSETRSVGEVGNFLDKSQSNVWEESSLTKSVFEHSKMVESTLDDLSSLAAALREPGDIDTIDQTLAKKQQRLEDFIGVKHFYDPSVMHEKNSRAKEIRRNGGPTDEFERNLLRDVESMEQEMGGKSPLNGFDINKLAGRHEGEYESFVERQNQAERRLDQIMKLRKVITTEVPNIPENKRKELLGRISEQRIGLKALDKSRSEVSVGLYGAPEVELGSESIEIHYEFDRNQSPIARLSSALSTASGLSGPSRERPKEFSTAYNPKEEVQEHFQKARKELNGAKISMMQKVGEGKVAEVHWKVIEEEFQLMDSLLDVHEQAHLGMAGAELTMRTSTSSQELGQQKQELLKLRSQVSQQELPELNNPQFKKLSEAKSSLLKQLDKVISEVSARTEVAKQVESFSDRSSSLINQVKSGEISLDTAFRQLEESHALIRQQAGKVEEMTPQRPYQNNVRPQLTKSLDQQLQTNKTQVMAGLLGVQGERGMEAVEKLTKIRLIDSTVLGDTAKALPGDSPEARGEYLAGLLEGVGSDPKTNSLEAVESFASKIYPPDSGEVSSEKSLRLQLMMVEPSRRDQVETRHIAPKVTANLEKALKNEAFIEACKAFDLPVPENALGVLKTVQCMVMQNPDAFEGLGMDILGGEPSMRGQLAGIWMDGQVATYMDMMEGKPLSPEERTEMLSLSSTLESLTPSVVVNDQLKAEVLLQKYSSELLGDTSGKTDFSSVETQEQIREKLSSIDDRPGVKEVQKRMTATVERLEQVKEGVELLDNMISPALERLRDHLELDTIGEARMLLSDPDKQRAVYETAVFLNYQDLKEEMDSGEYVGGLTRETIEESEKIQAKEVRNFNPESLTIDETSFFQSVRTFFNPKLNSPQRIAEKLTSRNAPRLVNSYIEAFQHYKVQQALVENELLPLSNGVESLRKERDGLLSEVERHQKTLAVRMAILTVVRDLKLPFSQFSLTDPENRKLILEKAASLGVTDRDLGLVLEDMARTSENLSESMVNQWSIEGAGLPSELENRLSELQRKMELLVDGINNKGSKQVQSLSESLNEKRTTPLTAPTLDKFGPAFSLEKRAWAKSVGVDQSDPGTMELSEGLSRMQTSLMLESMGTMSNKEHPATILSENIKALQDVVSDIQEARLAKIEKPGVIINRLELQIRLNQALDALESQDPKPEGVGNNYKSIVNGLRENQCRSLDLIRTAMEHEITLLI